MVFVELVDQIIEENPAAVNLKLQLSNFVGDNEIETLFIWRIIKPNFNFIDNLLPFEYNKLDRLTSLLFQNGLT